MGPRAALNRDIETALGTTTGAVALERAVAGAVREHVSFDRWCVLTVDPATALPTGGYHQEGVPHELLPQLAEIEARGDDALALTQMARQRQRASTLDEATAGDPEVSARYREIFKPSNIRHELRVTFNSGGGIWGVMIAFRYADSPAFSPQDVTAVEVATRPVAGAIRRELLLADIERDAPEHGPGLILLDEELQPSLVSAAAQNWLADIDDDHDQNRNLPFAVLSLAKRATTSNHSLRARLRTRSGHWLTLHAEHIPSGVSVIAEPTRPLELAQLVADAYGLTPREREIARLLALGHSRAEIAAGLGLSPHTVDDYVKKAFGKTGVQSRAELAARLFFDHNMPRINEEVPVGGSGWFIH